jgi:hypothetical protein
MCSILSEIECLPSFLLGEQHSCWRVESILIPHSKGISKFTSTDEGGKTLPALESEKFMRLRVVGKETNRTAP